MATAKCNNSGGRDKRLASKTAAGKPCPDFPLTPHKRGSWYRRRRDPVTRERKAVYVGKHADPAGALDALLAHMVVDSWNPRDEFPAAQAAVIAAHIAMKPGHEAAAWSRDPWQPIELYMRAVREAVAACDDLSLGSLCAAFLADCQARHEATRKGAVKGHAAKGMAARTVNAYRRACQRITERFGENRRVTDLEPADFAAWRRELFAEADKPKSILNTMVDIRRVFSWNHANRRYETDGRRVPLPDYGAQFSLPSEPELRAARDRRKAEAPRYFPRPLIHAILRRLDLVEEGTAEQWRAMFLLSLNGGMYQLEVSRLKLSEVDLETGEVKTVRWKTWARRYVPLWRATVEAIRDYLPTRPKPAAGCEDLLFLHPDGGQWTHDGNGGAGGEKPNARLGYTFRKLLRAVADAEGLAIPDGLGFGACRHTFATDASGARDPQAVAVIKGDVETTINDAHYVQFLETGRPRKVAEHVWRQIFEVSAARAPEAPTAADWPAVA